jgi:hypothetical protein
MRGVSWRAGQMLDKGRDWDDEDVQFSPSIFETLAMLPAPKACAGRAKSTRRAMVRMTVEVSDDGILVMFEGNVVMV